MGLNKKVIMKVGLTLFLMAFTATVEGRFDPNTFLAQMMKDNGEPNYLFIKSTTTACCDHCVCSYDTLPPRCHCHDVGETCHSDCKSCHCTFSISNSQQCRCADTIYFCDDPCSSSAVKPQVAN